MSIHGSGAAASAPADDMPSAPTVEKATSRTEAYTGPTDYSSPQSANDH